MYVFYSNNNFKHFANVMPQKKKKNLDRILRYSSLSTFKVDDRLINLTRYSIEKNDQKIKSSND